MAAVIHEAADIQLRTHPQYLFFLSYPYFSSGLNIPYSAVAIDQLVHHKWGY
jgi:hypothetical protein